MNGLRLLHPTDPHRMGMLCLLAFLLLFSGAASATKLKLKKLPERLNKDGLVVMQLGPHSTWGAAKVELGNGKKFEAHNGFLVAKLRPGQYEIAEISALAGWDSIKTAQVYDILTVGREFEIQAGKVTHLGMLYFLADPGNGRGNETRRYVTLAFKSMGPEMAYLREYYPALAANISEPDVVVAPYDYANDKLPAIREMLIQYYAKSAYEVLNSGRELRGMNSSLPLQITKSNYVIGDLGLIARAGSGKLEFLETGTVSRIGQLEFPTTEPWFYSRTGAVYHLRDNTIARVASIPDDFLLNNGAMLGNDRIVLTDRRFNLLTSIDGGRSWSRYDALSLPDNQSVSSKFSAASDRVFAIATDPAYFFKKSAIAAVSRVSAEIDEIVLPKKVSNGIQGIYETDAGLFVHSQVRMDPTALHFLKTGGSEWDSNAVSNYFGCTISFANSEGTDVRALCGTSQHPAYLQSRDYGRSWQPVQRTAAKQ